MRVITLGGSLFAVWVLLSGHFEPLLLGLGLLSSALVVAIAIRMDVVDHEGVPVQLGRRLLFYIPWLVKEIVKANVAVMRVVLSPSLPISPAIVRVRGLQKTDLGRVIFANSITLTPGTITVGVQGEELTVHALVSRFVDEMEEGDMNRRVAALEGVE